MEQTREGLRKTYCAFCETGYEQNVLNLMERLGYEGMVPYATREVYEGKKRNWIKRLLLPGYVFFTASDKEEYWLELLRLNHMIRILKYENGSFALIGRDLEFVEWLRRNGGCIEISRMYKEGDRIRVADGPLKDYEGRIVKYNPKRRCVAIMIGTEALPVKVWCSVELIDAADRSPKAGAGNTIESITKMNG